MSLHGIRISGFSLCRYIRFYLSANLEAVDLSKKPWIKFCSQHTYSFRSSKHDRFVYFEVGSRLRSPAMPSVQTFLQHFFNGSNLVFDGRIELLSGLCPRFAVTIVIRLGNDQLCVLQHGMEMNFV